MPKEGTGDKVAELLAEIFEEMTGKKYKVKRTGFSLSVEPEEEARAETAKSESGQSPEQDTFETADKLLEPEQQTLAEEEPPQLKLRTGLAKFRTAKGWYIKAFDDEGKIDEENTSWLCSELVKFVQELSKSISARSNDSRDRAYPARSKGGIYVNNEEMLYLEKLAEEQNIAIMEKEFPNNG